MRKLTALFVCWSVLILVGCGHWIKQVEHREALETCLRGYGYDCRHELLTKQEAEKVRQKEKASNIKACILGEFRCRRDLLPPPDLAEIKPKPEFPRGRPWRPSRQAVEQPSSPVVVQYQALPPRPWRLVQEEGVQATLPPVQHSIVQAPPLPIPPTQQDGIQANAPPAVERPAVVQPTLPQIQDAPSKAYSHPYVSQFSPSTFTRSCAENGSCYGDISARTGLPKTVEVSGYYRRDGTYVRGHYRSHR